jgi:hypothetical protein
MASLTDTNTMDLIFTNDDLGGGDERHVHWFQDVIDFLNGRGIRGTFFWIPKAEGMPSDQRTELMAAIYRAREQGHDFQLHGLTHQTCLEFGVPPNALRRENPRPFAEYEANPEKWAAEHTRARLRAKLEEGVEIYERAFGERPVIFRSPCVGTCPALYEALADVGITHDSSWILNPHSWVYTATVDPTEREWQVDPSAEPFMLPEGVQEFPLMADYTHWGISQERFDDFLALAKRDYDQLAGGKPRVAVMLSHYHSMHKDWDRTVRFWNQLLDHLASKGLSRFVTFKEMIANSV